MTSEEYVRLSSKVGWKFNMVVDNPFSAKLNLVHPLKQGQVNDIVQKAKEHTGIRRIIVFGSSVTNRCNPFSDLDICIDWEFESHDEDGVYKPETLPLMKYISMRTKGNCDVLAYDDTEGEPIRNEIDSKGGCCV